MVPDDVFLGKQIFTSLHKQLIVRDDSNQTTTSDYQSKSSRIGFREGLWIDDFCLDQTTP